MTENNAYAPPVNTGLTSAQVAERTQNGYANIIPEDNSNSVGQIIKRNTLTFFNLLFFVLAACLILVQSYTNLTFLIVIVINTVIGTVQEIRSKKVLDQLSVLSAPHAEVIRDGRIQEVLTDELVLDDLIRLTAGRQIPADARIVSGSVSVNESLVTGESDEITKGEGQDLYSGSFIVSGSCIAVLTAVGTDSFASRLTLEAKKGKKRQVSEMLRSLNRLIRVIGVLLVPLGIMMFYRAYYVLDNSLQQSVVSTVAALTGMIPEGLFLLTSIALAVSTVRLAQKKTMVHDMGCIETLARVDVLCVDKTGTITEPEMKVTDLVPLKKTEAEIVPMLSALTGALDAENATMKALKEAYTLPAPRKPISIAPFSSKTKYSGVTFSENESYVIGAPEFLIGNIDEALRSKINALASMGKRVLLFASYEAPLGGPLRGRIEPLALVALMNPIRKEAKETFQYFAEQNVTVKVISGDNPVTVSQIASQAGIANSEFYVDASTLTTDEAIWNAAEQYTIFGRVTPDQKRTLVHALKAAGHTVAMTGDGVNDVLALRDADCSIAMASGSEAASQVAQLVLLDSNFACMPAVVAEGRRVVNNIERAASLFLVKNIFSFLIAVIMLFIPFTYPLTPLQLSLISSLTIGAPSFFLALEPNTDLVSGRFLRNVLYRATPAGLTNLFLILGVLLFSFAFAMNPAEIETICVVLMGFVGFLMLYRVAQPFNLKHAVLWFALLLAFILALLLFPALIEITALKSLGSWLVAIVFLMLAIPTIGYITSGMNHISNFSKKFLVPFFHKVGKKWNE